MTFATRCILIGSALIVVSIVVELMVPSARYEVLDGNVIDREHLVFSDFLWSGGRLLTQLIGAALIGTGVMTLIVNRRKRHQN